MYFLYDIISSQDIMKKLIRRNDMKRVLLLSLLLLLIFSAQLPEQAMARHKIGDVIGSVVATDIKTFINGKIIPSYNINGRTAVIVQQLPAYGILNSFDEETRVLSLSYSGKNSGGFVGENKSDKEPGTVLFNVSYTDITAEFGGTVLESFNIQSLTAVYADELAALCGEYVWDENDRIVSITLTGGKEAEAEAVFAMRTLPSNLNPMTKESSTARWGEPGKSHIVQNGSGFYAVEICENINIEEYDSNKVLVNSFAIPKELQLFGTLYAGENYNYIAFGQPNYEQDDTKEVIKIVIYDKAFIKISEISVRDCFTVLPFDASNASMCENGRYLMLHTSRTQYMDESGNLPQTQLTVIVDKWNWNVVNSLFKFQSDHTSHALFGFSLAEDDRFVTADLSDAVPERGIILRAIDFEGRVFGQQNILAVPGELGANCTGVSPGGFVRTKSGYLLAFNSVDHSRATSYNSMGIDGLERDDRDIYLIYADHDSWAVNTHLIEGYSYNNFSGSTPHIVPAGNDRFVILWEEFDESALSRGIKYVVVNSAGETIKKSNLIKYASGREIHLPADSFEIYDGKCVMWYLNTEYGRIFYCVNVSDEEKNPNFSAEQPEINSENNLEEKPQKENKKKITEVEGI